MTTLFKLQIKRAAFKDKLKLYVQRVNKGVFDMFQTLAEILKDSKLEQTFSKLVSSYLSTRKAEVLNSLIMKITAKENDTNDILQTFR